MERAFGMLKCRFRRLLRFDSCNMHLLVNSVLAACVLHNLCVLERDAFDFSEVNEDDICQNDLFARDGQQIYTEKNNNETLKNFKKFQFKRTQIHKNF